MAERHGRQPPLTDGGTRESARGGRGPELFERQRHRVIHDDDAHAEEVQEQLDALTDQLASMCHLAGQAIELATDTLVLVDLPTAEQLLTAPPGQLPGSRNPADDCRPRVPAHAQHSRDTALPPRSPTLEGS